MKRSVYLSTILIIVVVGVNGCTHSTSFNKPVHYQQAQEWPGIKPPKNLPIQQFTFHYKGRESTNLFIYFPPPYVQGNTGAWRAVKGLLGESSFNSIDVGAQELEEAIRVIRSEVFEAAPRSSMDDLWQIFAIKISDKPYLIVNNSPDVPLDRYPAFTSSIVEWVWSFWFLYDLEAQAIKLVYDREFGCRSFKK